MDLTRVKIGVISTWNGLWGGSEELWATMVEEAFKERLEVAVSICHGASVPSKFPSLHNGVRVFRAGLCLGDGLKT